MVALLEPERSSQMERRSYPLIIKYMGSKSKIIDFVVSGISDVSNSGLVCDLFAGTCSLSGAIGHRDTMISNDIQSYSAVLASCYLNRISDTFLDISTDWLVEEARVEVEKLLQGLPENLDHRSNSDLGEFNQTEILNQSLIKAEFSHEYHLFLKNYSGTWWSARQCAWIDALRKVADRLLIDKNINSSDHSLFLAAIMHAMAYCGQGTGHFAQYRDANTVSSMNDILIYRSKSFEKVFSRKLASLRGWNYENVVDVGSHQICSLDFRDCLRTFENATIYADPPYAFVHYSRFYHALETLVLYDYPDLQEKGGKLVKGRYRDERHQSPFCIKSQVPDAFSSLFNGVAENGSNLVLSYSNSGMISLEALVELATNSLGSGYDLTLLEIDHKHMTMGRLADREREVREALLIAKKSDGIG